MIDFAIVIFYLFVTLLLGLRAGRNVKTFNDYAIADKSYPTPFLIATMFATSVGATVTMGTASKVYSVGVIVAVACFGSAFCDIFTAYFFSDKFPKLKNTLTAGDIVERHYNKTAKIITGLAGVSKYVGLVAVQIGAISISLNHYLGINKPWGILIAYLSITLYSTIGGIRSVTVTDN